MPRRRKTKLCDMAFNVCIVLLQCKSPSYKVAAESAFDIAHGGTRTATDRIRSVDVRGPSSVFQTRSSGLCCAPNNTQCQKHSRMQSRKVSIYTVLTNKKNNYMYFLITLGEVLYILDACYHKNVIMLNS